uniref:Choline kinase beta n=1 Tax=Myotis myotis TaxID=51298 RepID=A0A7J7QUI6_MYOMY|nr:choline kinase beta [Myotis myotis]
MIIRTRSGLSTKHSLQTTPRRDSSSTLFAIIWQRQRKARSSPQSLPCRTLGGRGKEQEALGTPEPPVRWARRVISSPSLSRSPGAGTPGLCTLKQ